MEFKQKRACIVYSIIALFMALVYSYKDAIWVNEQYAMYFKRGDTSTPIYLILIYSALFVILIVAVAKICENRAHFLCGSILVLTIVFYFSKMLLEDGLYSAITSPTTPLVYLVSLAVFVGMDDGIWNAVRRILPILIIAYICLLGYEYITLVARYGVVVVGNSSLIYYYVSLFWCSVVYLTDRILRDDGIGLPQALLIGFNVIFAVIINSRSWIIQSCLVGIAIYLLGTTQHNVRIIILRVILLMLTGYLIVRLLQSYFSNNLIFLSDKLGRDSRSHQYADIAGASSFLGWVFGNGASAVYYDSTQGYISNIDNQYVFIAFHYGIVVLLQWLVPQVKTLLSIMKSHSIKWIAMLPIVCWLMALGGLSVFNVVYCDVKQLVIMLYMGHILSLSDHGGYADE